ncbi:MAG: TIGR04282 family arsenosugar biosynthesis glycosyltransferase [bacterium]
MRRGKARLDRGRAGWARRLVVFVKAPKMGRAKTRLATGIGAARAASFYRQSTQTLLANLSNDRRWQTVLAVDPVSAVASGWPPIWPPHLPRIAQGSGDLGARMGGLFQFLPPGPVIIIGSDAPQISQAMIAEAFAKLDGHEVVIGPAEDGGYWLIGLKRQRLAPNLFANVRWSSEHTLDDTLASLPEKYRIAYLQSLTDVDDAADLDRLQSQLLRSRTCPLTGE